MSRVKRGQKYMNVSSHTPEPSKVEVVSGEADDYTKATTLRDWLMLKYGMSRNTYKKKSKERKNALRQEFEEDTGIHIEVPCAQYDEDDADDYMSMEEGYAILADAGVPFDEWGEPLGIG